ncbi:Endoplasmic reticulum lectin 1 [Entomophthora muscae]|uniref:Endoplasmic reticulum lectin 1 n=1 Tax=Entomophthora muscae TaxID=34485 RepID=A0ACC2RV89_9FUNG|nr:Endoplasmic reticulum lectin 1 [Entomophthora muscae]
MRLRLGFFLYYPLSVFSGSSVAAKLVIPHYLLQDGAGTQNLATIYLHRFITKAQAEAWSVNEDPADLPSELLLKGRRTLVRASPQLVYACRIPPPTFSKSKIPRALPSPERFLERTLDILSRKNGSCTLTEIKGWNYNFCFNKWVEHYAYFGTDEQVEEVTFYYLGNASFPRPISRRLGNDKYMVAFSGIGITAPWYVAEKWTQGTICDLTGMPRVAEIRYSCHPIYPDGVFKVEENSVCNYIIEVNLVDLCDQQPEEASVDEHTFCAPITEGTPLSSPPSPRPRQNFTPFPPASVRWWQRWRSQQHGQNHPSNIRRVPVSQLAQHFTMALSPGTLSLRSPRTENELWASPAELYAVMDQETLLGVMNVEIALDAMLGWELDEPGYLWWENMLKWEEDIRLELLNSKHYLFESFSFSTPALD